MQETPQFAPQKVCLSCDGCCRFKKMDSVWRPKVASEEIDAGCYSKRVVIDEVFSKEIDENDYIKAVECRGQIQCVFFQMGDNRCHMYDYRPFECRLYPFLLVRKGKDAVIGVHLSCSYVQEKWENADFQNYVERLKQYFQKRDILEFIRRNQSLIRDYTNCEQEIEHLFTLVL